MRRIRKARTIDPRAARERRMLTYPLEMWSIIAAARNRENYVKVFSEQARAAAFMGRYYKFRMDAIECRAEGALFLRAMEARGVDSLGARYNTAGEGIGEITMTWEYVGEEADWKHAEKMEKEEGNAGGQVTAPMRMLERGEIFIPELDKLPEAKPDAGEDAVFRLMQETAAPVSVLMCEHEWNDIDICVKCGKPKDVE